MTFFSMMLTAALVIASAAPAHAQPRDGAPEPQQAPIQARPGGPETSPKSDLTVDVA